MASGTNLQSGNPVLGTLDRLPQTTNTPDVKNAPFTRISRGMSRRIFKISSTAYAGLIDPVLKAVGGHVMRARLEIISSGGVAGGTNAVAAADGPYNVIQSLIFTDPFGTQVFNLAGYDLRLAQAYGCQFGQWGVSDPASLASYSPASAGGNFPLPLYPHFAT